MTTPRTRRTGPQDILFEECPGHYDDDRALLHGEYFCDGMCTEQHADECECSDCETERALQDDYDASVDR